MSSYVYILHFSQPLAHAQHYTGATDRLLQRLHQHCGGSNGGRLPKVFHALGVSFVVGRVEEYDDHSTAFRRERQIKRGGHGPRYCQICTPARRRQRRLAGGRLWTQEERARLMCDTTAEERATVLDRLHFMGRHDGADEALGERPYPDPATCQVDICITLRHLITKVEGLEEAPR